MKVFTGSINYLANSIIRRTIVFATLLFCFFFSASSHPGDSSRVASNKKGLVIKVDLAAPIVTLINYRLTSFGRTNIREYMYSFAVEKLFAQQHSLQISWLSLLRRSSNTAGIPDQLNTWFFVAPEYKYYVSGRRDHQGFYVGANLKYVRGLSQTAFEYGYRQYGTATGISQNTGASFIMGVQFSGKRGFTFDLLSSVGFITELSYSYTRSPNFNNTYYYSYYNQIPYDYPIYYNGASSSYMDFRLAINLGYRF